MRELLIGLLAFAMVTMIGCLGLPKVEMSAADRAQVKSVKINAGGRLPPMSYPSKAQAVGGALGGAVGGLVASAIAGDPAEEVLAIMNANNIHLPSILAEEFSKAMQSQGWQVADLNSPADAEMVLTVNYYGLSSPPFSSILRPSLNVSASLRKPDGNVIWQKNGHIKINDGSSFEAYAKQPELLREIWRKVSKVVSNQIVAQGLFPLP